MTRYDGGLPAGEKERDHMSVQNGEIKIYGKNSCSPQSLRACLSEGRAALKEAGIPEADTDARLLFEHVFGLSGNAYFLHMEDPADPEKMAAFTDLIRQRVSHVPVQYLTGEAWFYGRSFLVTPDVLIPRFDTELLVQTAWEHLTAGGVQTGKSVSGSTADRQYVSDGVQTGQGVSARELDTQNAAGESPGRQRSYSSRSDHSNIPARVLDLCTGSGCVLLTLAAEYGAAGTGSDISPAALAVARQNAERLSVQAGYHLQTEFIQSDLFEQITGTFDLITANPPYIASVEIDTLDAEVSFFEPRLALDGKEDGLYYIRRIAEQAGDYLNPGGWLCMEIGFDQGAAAREILQGAGFVQVEIRQDLSGRDRVAAGRKKPAEPEQ